MKTQLYWLPWNFYPRADDEVPRPGQFVFKSNDDETLTGFVADVDYNLEKTLFCLFEPADLNIPELESVKQQMTENEMLNLLKTALDTNPKMKEEWQQTLQSS